MLAYCTYRFWILVLITCLCKTSYAFPVIPGTPITSVIAEAKVIVIVRLESYTPDPEVHKRIASGKIVLEDGEAFTAIHMVKPPARYNFRVMRRLRGECGDMLQLNLPAIYSYYYPISGTQVGVGNTCILFLHLNDKGELVPTNATLPIMRLIDTQQAPIVNEPIGANMKLYVTSLLLSSLVDTKIRLANTHLLKDIIEPQIPLGLIAYVNDPDLGVRDNVLYALAINQQVSAIPLIARLQAEQSRQGNGVHSVVALENYKTPAAVPHLNPLLFEIDEYTRLNAAAALRNLPHRSSIPYLMLALQDPDPQQAITYDAYATLKQLIPRFGEAADVSYFYSHFETETRPFYTWWSAELRGKHLPAADKANPSAFEIPANDQEALTYLNPLLFSPHIALRQQAMGELEKRAEPSSIPYLMLALRDPDTNIAYRAYSLISRLVKLVPIVRTEAAFAANRKAANKPLFQWWDDELLGKHIKSSATGRQSKLNRSQQKSESPNSRASWDFSAASIVLLLSLAVLRNYRIKHDLPL